jgi:thymidine kinase
MIELVTGPMFSSKSEHLLSEASRYKSVGYEVLFFKPRMDTRSSNEIFSRIGRGHPAIEISEWSELEDRVIRQYPSKTIVLIDELQFMPESDGIRGAGRILWDLLRDCKYEIVIVAAGLMFTTELKIFPTTASVMTVSDRIIHRKALCKVCGKEAAFTICTMPKSEDVLVGDDIYEARCGRHYDTNNPNWHLSNA